MNNAKFDLIKNWNNEIAIEGTAQSMVIIGLTKMLIYSNSSIITLFWDNKPRKFSPDLR